MKLLTAIKTAHVRLQVSIQVYLPAIDAWKTNEKLPVRSIDLFPAAWLEPIGGPKENGEKHKQL